MQQFIGLEKITGTNFKINGSFFERHMLCIKSLLYLLIVA